MVINVFIVEKSIKIRERHVHLRREKKTEMETNRTTTHRDKPDKKDKQCLLDTPRTVMVKDSVHTSFFFIFLSTFEFQSASVTLKMRSRSPKSNHFFPPSK